MNFIFYNVAHWIVKAWWFKKQFKNEENELEERTLLAIPHRLSTLKSSDIDVLQHNGTIEVRLIINNHLFTCLIDIFIFGN